MTTMNREDKSPYSIETFEAEPNSLSRGSRPRHAERDTGKKTQRAVISLVLFVFDPLGIVPRFTVAMRLLMNSI